MGGYGIPSQFAYQVGSDPINDVVRFGSSELMKHCTVEYITLLMT